MQGNSLKKTRISIEIEFKVLKEFGLEGTKTKISPEDEENE